MSTDDLPRKAKRLTERERVERLEIRQMSKEPPRLEYKVYKNQSRLSTWLMRQPEWILKSAIVILATLGSFMLGDSHILRDIFFAPDPVLALEFSTPTLSATRPVIPVTPTPTLTLTPSPTPTSTPQSTQIRPREGKYPVWHIIASTWAAWFDRDDKHTGDWVYIKNTVYTDGTPVLICAMGGFSRGDRSLPDVHRVGETRADQFKWCKHGTITGDKPDPPIRGDVGASISQDFREYACEITNASEVCVLNDLTEIVVLVVAERYRDN